MVSRSQALLTSSPASLVRNRESPGAVATGRGHWSVLVTKEPATNLLTTHQEDQSADESSAQDRFPYC
jgi:hypothetical protein